MDAPVRDAVDVRQLDLYAEDFGALFADYAQVRRQLDALVGGRAAPEYEPIARIFAHSSNGIVVTDADGHILSVNPALCRKTGYAESELIGCRPHLFASGRHDAGFYRRMWQALAETGEWQGEIWNRRRNGEVHPEWLHITAVRDADGQPAQYIGMYADLARLQQVNHQLAELANYDPLTALPNRNLCAERLRQALVQAQRSGGHAAVLFLDLDRFKQINDTLGYAVGDQLLIDFSWRLVHAIGDGDTAARLNGDEFVVVMPDLAHDDQPALIADKIIRSLEDPFVVDAYELYVGVSIGIAVFPAHGESAGLLLERADAAMSTAKRGGGNALRFFDDTLVRQRAERVDLEAALRRAQSLGELSLVYQPQVAADDGRIVGVEALLRWHRAGHGAVPPDRFIPIAEEIGLIGTIGDWVLHAACRQLALWRAARLPAVRMAVNVTARQLDDRRFAARVIEILNEFAVPPALLEIEITESQLMEGLTIGLDTLTQLRAHGIAIAVDDFGTGYSSLGRIRTLPIDRIKIDKSFVVDLERKPDSYAIAHAIVAMVNALKLEAIAEGVENAEQALLLAGIQCPLFQGYHFGRPQTAAEIEALLRQLPGDRHAQPQTADR